MGKSTPSPPDPVATANAQAGANKEAIYESARTNQIGETTPYGTLSYSGDIGSPNRQRTITLAPQYQAILDQMAGYSSQAAGRLPTGEFNLNGLPELPTNFSADRQRSEDALYGRATSRLDPQWQNAERDFETRMKITGIPMGSEAYMNARKQFDQSRTDAYESARNASISGGGAEESRLFNMASAGRGQGINERILMRQQPLQELVQLLTGAPALQTPSFGQQAQYQQAPPDVIGATNQGYQNSLAASKANNPWGTLASLGGAFAPLAWM